jgi:hypothetical protein
MIYARKIADDVEDGVGGAGLLLVHSFKPDALYARQHLDASAPGKSVKQINNSV